MNQLVFVYDKAEEGGIPVGIPTDDNDVRRENEPFTAYGFDSPDLKHSRASRTTVHAALKPPLLRCPQSEYHQYSDFVRLALKALAMCELLRTQTA